MTLEHAEHAKWATKRRPVMNEYVNGVKEALNNSAERGFSKPPANMIGNIVEIGKITKLKLIDANGALYQEQSNIIYQQAEFDAKMVWEYDKLILATYIQDLLNALAIENAQMDEAFKMDKAYINKLKADIDARNYDLIIGKADIDSQLIDYKIREVEAERLGLGKELELIAAQIITAEERLKIIPWLNELIIKERAILVLEEQKAVVLQAIIAIERDLAAIKESMIPLYEEKADAKTQQAMAITDEVQWKEALINLGFDRIDLKATEVAADITENEKKELLEEYQLNLIKASNALDLAKSNYSIALTDYKTSVATTVIDLRENIKTAAISLGLDSGLERMSVNLENDVKLKNDATGNITTEIASTINKIIAVASTIKKSSRTSETDAESRSDNSRHIKQKIKSGFFY